MEVSHAVRHQPMTPQEQQENKQEQAMIPAETGMQALSKGHQHEKAQPQQHKRQQQQDLCGKATKVAGNEDRNITVNVAAIKKFGGRERSVAVVFVRSGSEGLQGSGNTVPNMPSFSSPRNSL